MPGCTANSTLVEHTVCGAAEAHGEGLGEAYIASPAPQASFANDVGGSFAVAGGGKGGVNSSASGSGTFGEIHLTANADNGMFQTPSFDKWGSTSATSEIAFGDGGVLGGLAAGTPIIARLTVRVDGSFSGAADADVSFILQDGLDPLVNVSGFGGFLSPLNPSYLYTQDFTIMSGDALHFYMDLYANAETSNKGFTSTDISAADVSHTGHLFFDILTPGATFASYSGHDYASLAAPPPGVPEPATWAMAILGFGGIGLQMRRDRRRSAWPAA
jgi:hypothetical protein